MVMIQDGPQNTGADKPLRISGEPFKVQVGPTCFIIAPQTFQQAAIKIFLPVLEGLRILQLRHFVLLSAFVQT